MGIGTGGRGSGDGGVVGVVVEGWAVGRPGQLMNGANLGVRCQYHHHYVFSLLLGCACGEEVLKYDVNPGGTCQYHCYLLLFFLFFRVGMGVGGGRLDFTFFYFYR